MRIRKTSLISKREIYSDNLSHDLFDQFFKVEIYAKSTRIRQLFSYVLIFHIYERSVFLY